MRPSYVSLIKHYVPTDERALRAALSDALGMVAQYRTDVETLRRLSVLGSRNAAHAEAEAREARIAASRAHSAADRARRELEGKDAETRALLVAAHRDGALSLDGLQGALDALSLSPYAEPIRRTFTFLVDVTLDVEGTDEESAVEALEYDLANALQTALEEQTDVITSDVDTL